jgi:DNA-binding MarR family transcriptional regulator
MKTSRVGLAPPPSSHLVPYLLSRAYNGFTRAWMEHLRDHGVTMAQWQILAILSEYDGARIGQLAEMSATAQAVTSRVIDQMERDGLVERHPVPDDRRAVEVRLTARGRATFETLLPDANALMDDAMTGIDPSTAQALMDGLACIIGNLAGAAAVPEHART